MPRRQQGMHPCNAPCVPIPSIYASPAHISNPRIGAAVEPEAVEADHIKMGLVNVCRGTFKQCVCPGDLLPLHGGTGCLHTISCPPSCLPACCTAMPAVPCGSPHLKCTVKSSNPLCCSGTANEKTAGCTWGGNANHCQSEAVQQAPQAGQVHRASRTPQPAPASSA